MNKNTFLLGTTIFTALSVMKVSALTEADMLLMAAHGAHQHHWAIESGEFKGADLNKLKTDRAHFVTRIVTAPKKEVLTEQDLYDLAIIVEKSCKKEDAGFFNDFLKTTQSAQTFVQSVEKKNPELKGMTETIKKEYETAKVEQERASSPQTTPPAVPTEPINQTTPPFVPTAPVNQTTPPFVPTASSVSSRDLGLTSPQPIGYSLHYPINPSLEISTFSSSNLGLTSSQPIVHSLNSLVQQLQSLAPNITVDTAHLLGNFGSMRRRILFSHHSDRGGDNNNFTNLSFVLEQIEALVEQKTGNATEEVLLLTDDIQESTETSASARELYEAAVANAAAATELYEKAKTIVLSKTGLAKKTAKKLAKNAKKEADKAHEEVARLLALI